MVCTCGLHPEDQTHGAWLRGKGFQLMACAPTSTGNDRSANKRWEARLDDYRDARKSGIQPAGTQANQIETAVRASDAVGKAFNATTNTFQ